jgi:hypothetical protein
MLFDPRNFVCVRPKFGEIDSVWSGEEIAGLKEVDVCIDIAGQDESAFAIDPFRPGGYGHLFATADSDNAIAVNNDHAVFQNVRRCRIDQRPADKGYFFGVRGQRENRECESKRRSEFHSERFLDFAWNDNVPIPAPNG